MPNVNKPMRIPELNLQPPITSKVRLSEDMQQTLALLVGYVNSRRVLLQATETGVLITASPQIKGIIVFTSSGAKHTWNGGDIPCTEIAVLAGLDNTGRVYMNPYSGASAGSGWPLDKGESFGFTISNLNHLYLYVPTDPDIAIIAYTG